MSLLQSVCTYSAGLGAAAGAGAAAYGAGSAFSSAIQGKSTSGSNASLFQAGINATIGESSDKTVQTVRHLVEGAALSAVAFGAGATAAATLDAGNSYTFGLGNFGFNLGSIFNSSNVTVLNNETETLANATNATNATMFESASNAIVEHPVGSIATLVTGIVVIMLGAKMCRGKTAAPATPQPAT